MTPDRFARVVEKVQRKDDWGIDCVSSDEVIKHLRREHQAVRKALLELPKYLPSDGRMVRHEFGTFVNIKDILARLDRRAR